MAESVPQVYVDLANLLNTQGFGFQPTKEGNELAILQRFFTVEDAQNMLAMKPDCFFTAQDYADYSGKSLRDARNICEDMSMRGLIYRSYTPGEEIQYRIQPMIAGIWEAHVDLMQDDMNKGNTEWIGKEAIHFGTTWAKQFYGSTDIPPFRSVPIDKKYVVGDEMLAVDDAEQVIRTRKKWAVVQCLCRTFTAATGGYDDPRKETCLAFDEYAQYYISIGIGRELTCDQALDIIHESIDKGLAIHVYNCKDVWIMCSCEMRTCALFKAKALFGGQATDFATNYRVVVDASKCNGCGTCVGRCPGECCSINDKGISETNPAICAGCGQCVKYCPSGARSLVLKPADERRANPNDQLFDVYENMQSERRASGEIK